MTSPENDLHSRSELLVHKWNIHVEEVRESESSLLVFGSRGDQHVVLKIAKSQGDEWHAGRILKAFEGAGAVRALEYVGGAVLLERIVPGTPLRDLVAAGDDDQATDVLAGLIQRLSRTAPLNGCVRMEDWAGGFDRYLQSDDTQIPRDLVVQAHETYLNLCQSQTDRRLLHGDLHHSNVLWDANRGWLAIDPKGVLGEVECEIGAALRNPMEYPELFASPEILERRIHRFANVLQLNIERTRKWAFAQAVLSAVWCWEDQSPELAMKSALDVSRELHRYYL